MKTKKLQRELNSILENTAAEPFQPSAAAIKSAEQLEFDGHLDWLMSLPARTRNTYVGLCNIFVPEKEGTDIWIARDNRFGTYAYQVQPKLTPDGLYLCAVPQELPSVNFNCTVWEHLVKTNECKRYKIVEVPE